MAGHPRPPTAAARKLTALAAAALLVVGTSARAAVQVPEPLRGGCAAATALRRLVGTPGPTGLRAALRLGLCLMEGQHFREATALLDRGSGHPTLAPYGLLWAGEAALAAGDLEGAFWRLERAVQAALPPPARARGYLSLSEASLRLGDAAAAQRYAHLALRHAPDDALRAAAWRLLGRASEAAGRQQEARWRYAMAWWGFPGTAASREAETDLRRLTGRMPVPPAVARAERACRLQDPRAALEEWRAALSQGLTGALEAEAWLRVGVLAGGTEGLSALHRAAAHPRYRAQARYWTGVILVRLGRDAEGVDVWRGLVRESPRSPWAARALAALAAHAQGRRDWRSADRYWSELVARFPSTALAGGARWERGWLRYRQRQYRSAERLWTQAAGDDPGSPWAAASLYWAAASRARQGLESRALLRRVAERYPHSYYGQRARERLGLGLPPPPAEGGQIVIPAERFAPAPVELAALGRYRDAAEAAEETLRSAQSRSLRALAAWARAAEGDLAGSVATAEALAVPWRPEAAGADAELWRLAYPLAHREMLWRWSAIHGADPLLVLAVMREESRFRTDAVSAAGAVGLMQLLPSTARGIDSSTRPDSLVDPEVNVRLGTAYLAGRLREFRGDVVAALVAYNAGPEAARRFLKFRGAGADEFVESIPYEETRAYVKRVLESYGIYRWLYRR